MDRLTPGLLRLAPALLTLLSCSDHASAFAPLRVLLPHCFAGLLGAWAVHHRRSGLTGMDDGAAAVPSGEEEQYHAYLLLSFQGSTKVLATGEELREVTER